MLDIVQPSLPSGQLSPLSGLVHPAGAACVQLGGGHLLHGSGCLLYVQLGLVAQFVHLLAGAGV